MSTDDGAVRRSIGSLAIFAVAVCLVPAGAHLFELANKMALPQAEYMTVQRIYAGWAFFGIAIFSALFLTAAHGINIRGQRRALLLALAALACLVVSQLIFWTFTYPMNAASDNWTRVPENFEAARRQWEYSHAGNAVVTFAAFVAITLSVLEAQEASNNPRRTR
jgi:hypothetical protein